MYIYIYMAFSQPTCVAKSVDVTNVRVTSFSLAEGSPSTGGSIRCSSARPRNIYIYIYIYREREICIYIYIYVYIYIYKYIYIYMLKSQHNII